MQRVLTQEAVNLKLLNRAFAVINNTQNLTIFKEGSDDYKRMSMQIRGGRIELEELWASLPKACKLQFCDRLAEFHLDKDDIFRRNVTNKNMICYFETLFKEKESEKFFKKYQTMVDRQLTIQEKEQPTSGIINRMLAPRYAFDLLIEFIEAKQALSNDPISRLIASSKADDRYYDAGYAFVNYFKGMTARQQNAFFKYIKASKGEKVLEFAKKITSKSYMESILSERRANKQADPFEKYLRTDI